MKPARALAAAALFLAASASVGCAPAVPVENPSPFDEDDPAARPERKAPSPARAAEPEPEPAPADATGGTIRRERLEQVLDRGLPVFLAGVEVEPKLDLRQNFEGWEIVRYDGGSYLRPGDVVQSVNGRPLERPGQVQALWEDLRDADEIVVRGRREGRPLTLRFEVVEGPAPATAEPPSPQANAAP